ncbi:MAG: septum formation protein Maf [Rhizobiales bacterium]|nr:septum formation protein Maf [Hyphomicrobiales bacterium]
MTAPVPLILASGSAIRAQLLARAGLSFSILRPDVDEAELKSRFGQSSPAGLAATLAEAKASAVSRTHPDALVIGADQVLNFAGQPHDKPSSIAEARAQLIRFRGKTHALETAVCCCRSGRPVWSHAMHADLTMREFTDAFLDSYLESLGEDVLTSVGGYKLEERGIQLFSGIEGDYFGILGLPLLPLLAFLRNEGLIAP